MRAPSVQGGFHAAINWFSSFGYFDDDGNRRVLCAFADALRPGGRLLLEMHDRDALVARIADAGEPVTVLERGDDLVVDRARFDPVAGRSTTERIVVRDGRVRRTQFTLRMPTFPELHGWLADAGFSHARALDEHGAPFASGARRLLVLATR
jgi:SAM-dependent methyltransferase